MMVNKLQIPCQIVISGGQTGVDRGALDACLKNNFPCGGWCPRGRMAEDGVLSKKYPLKEMEEKEYGYRTKQNIIDSDGTIILSNGKMAGGTLLTQQISNKLKKPVLIISSTTKIQDIIAWLIRYKIRILNIAGPRQSEWNEAYLTSFKLVSNIIREINISNSRSSLQFKS